MLREKFGVLWKSANLMSTFKKKTKIVLFHAKVINTSRIVSLPSGHKIKIQFKYCTIILNP